MEIMITCCRETPPSHDDEPNPPDDEELMAAAAAAAATRGGQDRISHLPDALLSSILGYLPVEEAARTRALSRAWRRPLWASAPRLDFVSPAADHSPQPQPDVVDRLLRLHVGRLWDCRLLGQPLPRLRGWVACLAQKRIQSLDLHGRVITDPKRPRLLLESSTLPPGAFAPAAASLRHLSLSYFRLPDAGCFQGCGPNLTSLHLSRITSMTDQMISDLLACCPRLESLSLSACMGTLSRPVIQSPTLRHLTLSYLSRAINTIVIDAEALAALTVVAVVCRGQIPLTLRARGLESLNTSTTYFTDHGDAEDDDRGGGDTASWRCRCTTNVIEHLSNIVDNPSFEEIGSPIRSLRRVALHLNLNDLRQVVVLRFMFMSCDALREVRIKNSGAATISDDPAQDDDRLLPYSSTEVWHRPDYAVCLWNFCVELRELWLDGYGGAEMETQFLAFLISNADGLRTLKIRCCSRTSSPAGAMLPAARELLATMQRASPDMDITFH